MKILRLNSLAIDRATLFIQRVAIGIAIFPINPTSLKFCKCILRHIYLLHRFYRCVKFNQEVEDYSVFEFDCPAGLAFDETTEVCVWPGSLSQGSPCPGSSEIAPAARVRFECPSTPGYYADPQNPRWFFACIDLGFYSSFKEPVIYSQKLNTSLHLTF